jgi:pilus assembly protein Flp/PilA
MLASIRLIRSFWSNRKGVTAVEYGLIAALVAAVIIGAATTMGSNLSGLFTTLGTSISTANTAATAGEPQ